MSNQVQITIKNIPEYDLNNLKEYITNCITNVHIKLIPYIVNNTTITIHYDIITPTHRRVVLLRHDELPFLSSPEYMRYLELQPQWEYYDHIESFPNYPNAKIVSQLNVNQSIILYINAAYHSI
jgi:hypothetical protein